MRRLSLALPLPVIALAASAAAAEPAARPAAEPAVEPGLDRVARTLGDPERQKAVARAMGAMGEAVLDLPLAPILAPLAEAAGEDPGRIDRDATLRKMAPGAAGVPRQIEHQLPRAMDAMAGMSETFAGMIVDLRDMAERMRAALPASTPGRPGRPVD